MRQTSKISRGRADSIARQGKIGRVLLGVLLVCIFCLFGGIQSKTAMAAGATITISTSKNTVVEGETVYIVITVRSSESIKGFDGYFTYDNRVLQFVTGGSVVHGNDDAFRIDDTERSAGATKITYSVKFLARKAGSASVSMRKPFHVYADDDNSSQMSVSYNTLNILVKKEADAATKPTSSAEASESKAPKESERPVNTGQPEWPNESAMPTPGKKDVPGSSKLRKLSIEGVELAPDFSSGINKYSALVTTDATELEIHYEAKDSQAKVVVKGNKNLVEGKNIIRVIVNSTMGEKTTYRLSLTVQRTESKTQANRVTVTEKKGKIYLKGTTKVEVLSVKEEDRIPQGFEKVETTIDGKEITSYALEGGEESSFVLIYGKGSKEELYLYDKEENTLMPYEKVKSWYRSLNGESVSVITAEERMIQSLKYVIGIMAAFCGLMLLVAIAASIRARRR